MSKRGERLFERGLRRRAVLALVLLALGFGVVGACRAWRRHEDVRQLGQAAAVARTRAEDLRRGGRPAEQGEATRLEAEAQTLERRARAAEGRWW